LQVWDGLLDQSQALGRERGRVIRNASDTAAWPRQAGDEAAADRIGYLHEQIGTSRVTCCTSREAKAERSRVRAATLALRYLRMLGH
jgi:hypothetical protein